MKIAVVSSASMIFATTFAGSSAFLPPPPLRCAPALTANERLQQGATARRTPARAASPQATDDGLQQLKERVRGLLDMTPSMLADGATMPPSAAPLEEAYASGSYNHMLLLFVEFFVDMKLSYDMGDDDMCRPTVHACTDPDDKVTKEKLPDLYLFAQNMIEGAAPEAKLGIWRLVVDRLAGRVGMDTDTFNDWCIRTLKE